MVRASVDSASSERRDAGSLHRMLAAVDGCPAPVVAGIHGYAFGGGAGLAACADVVVSAPDAEFGFREVRLGIAPAVISPFVLAKIGARARRYFVTGERFDPAPRCGSGSSTRSPTLDGRSRTYRRRGAIGGPRGGARGQGTHARRPAEDAELARIAEGLVRARGSGRAPGVPREAGAVVAGVKLLAGLAALAGLLARRRGGSRLPQWRRR